MAKKSVNWFHPSTVAKTRESPNDFMRNFLKFIKAHPEHKNLTPKEYALIRKSK